MGRLLSALRAAWLAGDCTAGAADLLEEARRLLRESGTADGTAAPDGTATRP
jgi:hypothetical protein